MSLRLEDRRPDGSWWAAIVRATNRLMGRLRRRRAGGAPQLGREQDRTPLRIRL